MSQLNDVTATASVRAAIGDIRANDTPVEEPWQSIGSAGSDVLAKALDKFKKRRRGSA